MSFVCFGKSSSLIELLDVCVYIMYLFQTRSWGGVRRMQFHILCLCQLLHKSWYLAKLGLLEVGNLFLRGLAGGD